MEQQELVIATPHAECLTFCQHIGDEALKELEACYEFVHDKENDYYIEDNNVNLYAEIDTQHGIKREYLRSEKPQDSQLSLYNEEKLFCNKWPTLYDYIHRACRVHHTQKMINELNNEISINGEEIQYFFHLDSMWFVKQEPGDYNPDHIHNVTPEARPMHLPINGIIWMRGIDYEKEPENHVRPRVVITELDPGKQVPVRTLNGCTNIIVNGKNVILQPTDGKSILMNVTALHNVYPFIDTSNTRITLSWNCYFTNNAETRWQF